MADPKTLSAKPEWHSPPMPTELLTYASRTIWMRVRLHLLSPKDSSSRELTTKSLGRPYGPTRSIELDVDIGADARDWSAIQAAEKLKPVEIELRRIEEVVSEIVSQMDYLRTREQKLRDTNESTNERVKWFAFSIMATLVGLGAWQVVYLRAYFRSVYYSPSRNLRRNTNRIGESVDQSILSKRAASSVSCLSPSRPAQRFPPYGVILLNT